MIGRLNMVPHVSCCPFWCLDPILRRIPFWSSQSIHPSHKTKQLESSGVLGGQVSIDVFDQRGFSHRVEHTHQLNRISSQSHWVAEEIRVFDFALANRIDTVSLVLTNHSTPSPKTKKNTNFLSKVGIINPHRLLTLWLLKEQHFVSSTSLGKSVTTKLRSSHGTYICWECGKTLALTYQPWMIGPWKPHQKRIWIIWILGVWWFVGLRWVKCSWMAIYVKIDFFWVKCDFSPSCKIEEKSK